MHELTGLFLNARATIRVVCHYDARIFRTLRALVVFLDLIDKNIRITILKFCHKRYRKKENICRGFAN